ncbi:MAG: DUF4838 domain-containing protein [Kiritimatiellae bacterium]|nr:DUF4838 domain-containing protein [Kiritimatiellia bacterium]MDD5519302.1 DUF4838 domain-containing protein [Kiritimatiellia bacterium]
MKQKIFYLLCTFLTFTLSISSAATNWKIVLPDSPTPVEKTAANELQLHLQKVTKGDFPIVAEKDVPKDVKSLIFVGKTSKSPQKNFAFDEILIQSKDGNLILTGHSRRGTLYAVYSFLQDIVGVRWWTPDETFIPKKESLEIPGDLNISYAPKMISREMYHRWVQSGIFSARMKGNGNIPPEYGGKVSIIHFVHSFYKIIPPEKYFDKHPEWFSEIKGKRTCDNAQLCLTNDELCKEVTKNILETLRKNPDARFIDISQNDWHKNCTCEKCKALDENEGSPAGSLVHFLNKVAAEVEKEFPDVLVESLAYQYTRKPPKFVKPRDNVLIRLCTIECSYIQPLTGEQNKKFAEDMEGWSKIAKHLFIWDYVTNYTDYIGPHPNLRVLAPNVRYFVENGAVGLFAEGEGDDFADMRNWVLMRLMWDPSLDDKVLFRDFSEGYYGKEIAPFIHDYWDVLINQAEKSKIYLGCFGMTSAQWIDLETLNRATEIMDNAVRESTEVYGDGSAELKRLRKVKMAVDHVWISRYYPLRCESREKNLSFLGPKDPLKAVTEFVELCHENKTKAHRITDKDAKQFETYLNNLSSTFTSRKFPPEMCKDIPEDTWIVFDDALFENYHDTATRVKDANASDGWTTRMPTKVDWNTGYKPAVKGKFQVYASMRCDATIDKGKAGSLGVYNFQEKRGLVSKQLKIEELKGEKYRWIDLGVVDFSAGAGIWFAHGHIPEVQALYVDRVVLIME